MKIMENYNGFEVGPIRPPSEARSLMLRVTRNCPWNRCKFCGLYKGKKFSVRPLDHVIRDINAVARYVERIRTAMENRGEMNGLDISGLLPNDPGEDRTAFHSALNWIRGGMESIFLQDANTLIVKPDDLVAILLHIRDTFPGVRRITSYSRSHSIARISDSDMERIAAAGLNRIHIGMESAADRILDFVNKGVDKKTHIIAGQRVKRAGIELSEYFMPGLGGVKYSRENALETADAVNRINPDFIRIRTLAIPENIELHKDLCSGAFEQLGDVQTAEELLLFLTNLDGITSTVKSDHILNLFQEVDGRLPEDKESITAPIRKFLAMGENEQLIYRVGRRTGVFSSLAHMNDPELLRHAEIARKAHGVTPENLEAFTRDMMKRFI